MAWHKGESGMQQDSSQAVGSRLALNHGNKVRHQNQETSLEFGSVIGCVVAARVWSVARTGDDLEGSERASELTTPVELTRLIRPNPRYRSPKRAEHCQNTKPTRIEKHPKALL